jgi:DNA-binding CsgD family transcriptional regulator
MSQSRNKPKTISRRVLKRTKLTPEDIEDLKHLLTLKRPKKRADCINMLRPCPFVSCKYHLYLDVKENGSIKLNFPDKTIWEMKETCALDVAEKGGLTLEEVGELMNLTRERVRQIENEAMEVLRKLGIDPEYDLGEKK